MLTATVTLEDVVILVNFVLLIAACIGVTWRPKLGMAILTAYAVCVFLSVTSIVWAHYLIGCLDGHSAALRSIAIGALCFVVVSCGARCYHLQRRSKCIFCANGRVAAV
jgi:hypothetical protein